MAASNSPENNNAAGAAKEENSSVPQTVSYEKYKELKDELEDKRRALVVVRDLAEFLSALDHHKETEILEVMLVRFTIEAVHAERGSLLIPDKNRRILRYSHTFTYKDRKLNLANYSDQLEHYRYDFGKGIPGEVYESQHEIIIEDVHNDERYDSRVDELLGLKTHSIICFPIIVSDEVEAIIELTRADGAFQAEEVDELLRIIVSLIATSMENARNFQWAITDSLTGLSNIHYFNKFFESEVRRAQRYETIFSLIILDLDNFKGINDNYGHKIGDLVLQSLSKVLVDSTRAELDMPARYGGDEFVILLPSTHHNDAKTVAKKILNAVNKESVNAGSEEITFTISMGISTFPEHGSSTSELFDAADKSLYHSKAKGKNAFSSYEETK